MALERFLIWYLCCLIHPTLFFRCFPLFMYGGERERERESSVCSWGVLVVLVNMICFNDLKPKKKKIKRWCCDLCLLDLITTKNWVHKATVRNQGINLCFLHPSNRIAFSDEDDCLQHINELPVF
ncbi:unnamed protein product [Musa acuminata subsp. malaccensis]|uniref:(wild Malaysian banana) hypothetical protein n=1 Tax=Musa acuminata subsp. malaccensis TaxID=214687 RepID=A0A804I5Z5_MUSAM|nr:unnamed protein product [Musa acuminata subsp. malaccensis]